MGVPSILHGPLALLSSLSGQILLLVESTAILLITSAINDMYSQGQYASQQYVFWLGPMFGAGLAAVIYGSPWTIRFLCLICEIFFWFAEYGSLKPENFGGARDMDTAIFDVWFIICSYNYSLIS
jgi:hypothetical protein